MSVIVSYRIPGVAMPYTPTGSPSVVTRSAQPYDTFVATQDTGIAVPLDLAFGANAKSFTGRSDLFSPDGADIFLERHDSDLVVFEGDVTHPLSIVSDEAFGAYETNLEEQEISLYKLFDTVGGKLQIPPRVLLYKIARLLERYFSLSEGEGKAYLQSFFATNLGDIVCRPKKFNSIIAKLKKKGFLDTIDPIIKEGIKKSDLKEIFRIALTVIYDGIGAKLLIKDPDLEARQSLMFSLLASISSKRLTITRIRNYRGANIPPYLTNEEINRIVRMQNTIYKGEYPIKVLDGNDSIKDSGYTSLQLDCQGPDGQLFDLHIRSVGIDELAQIESFYYKAKEPSVELSYFKKELRCAVKIVRSFNNEQTLAYDKYLRACFRYVRRKEMGQTANQPLFPTNLVSPHLRISQLKQFA